MELIQSLKGLTIQYLQTLHIMQLVMPFRIFNNLEAVVHYCSTIQKLTYLYTFSPSLHSSSVKCSDEGKDVSVFLSDYKIFSPLYKVYIHTIFLHTFGNSINDFYQVKRWVKRKKESAILKIVLCNQILNNPFSLLYSTYTYIGSLPAKLCIFPPPIFSLFRSLS